MWQHLKGVWSNRENWCVTTYRELVLSGDTKSESSKVRRCIEISTENGCYMTPHEKTYNSNSYFKLAHKVSLAKIMVISNTLTNFNKE